MSQEAEKNGEVSSLDADVPSPLSAETQNAPSNVPEVPEPPPPPKAIFDIIYETNDVNTPKQHIREDIKKFIKDSGLDYNYDFVFLYDDSGQITRYTSNRLYSAVTERPYGSNRDLFLLLHTSGGKVEPAYLISKCCKKSARKFVVAVPRFAKSAGTLLALGADEIHMGIISELGPIDPQIGDYPALGLGSAVEHIATLSARSTLNPLKCLPNTWHRA